MTTEPEASGAESRALSTAPAQPDWTARGIYLLSLLTLISAFNYLDRGILGLVLPLIKKDIGVSDTVLGLVSGLAFAVFYTLLGVPIAWAADRYNRRNIIAVGLAFWSIMTIATGFVVNIWQLALARFLMGAGEASCLAPSQSIISDVFRPERRPLAVSIFGTAFTLASIFFYPVIGWLTQHHGWRAAFIAAGAPGILLALLLRLTVREPARGGRDPSVRGAQPVPFGAAVAYLRGSRTFLLILLGATFMGVNAQAQIAWNPTFLVRVHHMSLTEVSGWLGPFRGVMALIGVLAGGIMADRFGRRDSRWRLWIPGLACLAVAPAESVFLLSPKGGAFVVGLAGSSALTLLHQGLIFAVILEVAQARMRATAIAITVLSSTLIGQTLGPLIVGWGNDALAPLYGQLAIRYSMLLMVGTAAIAGLCFLAAARPFAADAAQAANLRS